MTIELPSFPFASGDVACTQGMSYAAAGGDNNRNHDLSADRQVNCVEESFAGEADEKLLSLSS
ncbi:MAG: hypothetical protein U5R06_22580 [candidate division KSB1 bacterium]|nr:hypothetical protein [candidate division KSB1 bacterium]